MGILEELNARLELGLSKYTHGLWVDDDTRDWGTPKNSWLYMARDEFLDAMIYIAADYIRVSGMKRDENETDDSKRIMYVIDHYSDLTSAKHKMLIWNLFNMLDAIKIYVSEPG
tara:strand:- start:45 stop:386 length:342 start_codon:yes stop_codon:yes gene_type:complete